MKIGISDTAGLLHDRLSSLGASVTNYLCKNIDCLKLKNQNIEGITYASKIEKFEMQIDWFLSAELVDRQIRAFSPKPGAWFDLDGERIKILECQVSNGKDRPGVIMDASFQIACSSGSILPKVIQRSGKLPLPIKEFLTGFKVPIGKILVTANL